jgi:hypothetical protein
MSARWLALGLAWLAGCGPDEDGDGFRSDDCDDRVAGVNPGAAEVCDGLDTDCDGVVPGAERDFDGDGFVPCAVAPLAWRGSTAVTGGGDCDDDDPLRFPGAPERCNGVSDACGAAAAPFERDGDGDGFVGCEAEGPWRGSAELAPGDCDDVDPNRHPGAVEICDGVDDDCDAVTSLGETDEDGDGFVDCTPTSGWRGPAELRFGDCDDTLAAVFPNALERCDGVDGDCDGLPGPGEGDGDGDGVMACEAEPYAVRPGGDCDDARPETLPGAPEICDGLDNDCDGRLWVLELDADGDGYVSCRIVTSWSGDPTVRGGDDCQPLLPGAYPGALEALDGIDTSCDGVLAPAERDDDNDGYVEADADAAGWRGPPGLGGGDCDDTDPAVSPGAVERCDGVDQTCDGQPGSLELDRDGDGYVSCAFDPATWLGPRTPLGGGDCNDRSPSVAPGAAEVCDQMDDDCDGLVDEDDPDLDLASLRTFYRDDDHDDFGLDADTVSGCALPDGYAPNGLDCDDAERHQHPLARELCNGLDDDCDGLVDDEDDNLVLDLVVDWYFDGDGDGQGDPSVALTQCEPPDPQWVLAGTDCDDTDPGVFLGAPELCNGVDDDCDRHPDLETRGGAEAELGLGCDLCTTAADFDDDDIATEKWNPCVLDPTSVSLCYDGVAQVDTHQNGNRLHRVAWRTDVTAWRPELFVFIPPSKGTFNTSFLKFWAHAGYHVVIMSTATSVFLTDTCTSGDAVCSAGFLEEAHNGNPVSPDIDIGPSDGIEDRLLTLLQHLEAVHPGQGWDGFVEAGAVRWDKVILGGWSKGAPHALYAASVTPVAGLLLVSSPNDPIPGGVESPDCRNFALYHEREPEVPVVEFESGFRSVGMDGPTFVLEDLPYPWLGDPQVFTTRSFHYDRDDCSPHKATVFDGCVDADAARTPYIDLFCHMGEVDPATCP